MHISVGQALPPEVYRNMVCIREFEVAAIDLFKRGHVKAMVRPNTSQAASGVGVCL